MRWAVVSVGVVTALVGVALWSGPLAIVLAGVALIVVGLFFDDGNTP